VSITHHIALFDKVELLEPVEHVPPGSTGAVLEFHDGGKVAMVEFTSIPADMALERIEFVPLENLRVLKPHDSSRDAWPESD
jgi:hypothetical protein